MGKSLTVGKSESTGDPDSELELLLPRRNIPSRRTRVKSGVKIHITLFMIGLLSSLGCLWTMLYTADSEQLANSLGLHRVANSLENILALLGYPVLMFTVILTLYAGQQLYRLYRKANDPGSFRRNRSG